MDGAQQRRSLPRIPALATFVRPVQHKGRKEKKWKLVNVGWALPTKQICSPDGA